MPKGIYPRTEFHKSRCGFTKGHKVNQGKPSPIKGRKLSDEHKSKMTSMFKEGHIQSEETREKIRKTHMGMKASKETCVRISEGHLGQNAWNKGIPMSRDTKHRIGITKRRKFYEEMERLGISVSENEYPPLWHTVRKEVYKRDKFICQECFVKCTRELNGTRIQCHHIDYDKSNIELYNLITLCLSCHIKTNFGRGDWIKYFHNKLKTKELHQC